MKLLLFISLITVACGAKAAIESDLYICDAGISDVSINSAGLKTFTCNELVKVEQDVRVFKTSMKYLMEDKGNGWKLLGFVKIGRTCSAEAKDWTVGKDQGWFYVTNITGQYGFAFCKRK